MTAPNLLRILDLARWAPSGDNTQPWRLEVTGVDSFTLHGFDTRNHCVYDLDGRPSQLSLGAFVETAAIAASSQGLALHWRLREPLNEALPCIDLHVQQSQSITADPLVNAITLRSVHRRSLSTAAIEDWQWERLQQSMPPGYVLRRFEGWAARWDWARLLWANAGLRLRLPEAYSTHCAIIEWHARHSKDRIPDLALGASPLTLLLMRHALVSWRRVDFLNRWLAGTFMPRVELDLLPALACGAHMAIVADRAPGGVGDHVEAGRAVQRFWLTATTLGLQHQPAATPLVFARYVRERRCFTSNSELHALAERNSVRLAELLGCDNVRTVWLGRLGHGAPADARSMRLSVDELAHCPGGGAPIPTSAVEGWR